ncbi:MAG: GIY-YIG nuclease family protein [Anaerolineae bacterium]
MTPNGLHNALPRDALPALPGTYALLLHARAAQTVQVGRLGVFTLGPGWLVYVGSAQGPGGLRARVGRHCRAAKAHHWHIDYVTAVVPVQAVWAVVSTERLECRWAAALSALPGAGRPIAGFGASDCGCRGHLVAVSDPADVSAALAATPCADVLLYSTAS